MDPIGFLSALAFGIVDLVGFTMLFVPVCFLTVLFCAVEDLGMSPFERMMRGWWIVASIPFRFLFEGLFLLGRGCAFIYTSIYGSRVVDNVSRAVSIAKKWVAAKLIAGCGVLACFVLVFPIMFWVFAQVKASGVIVTESGKGKVKGRAKSGRRAKRGKSGALKKRVREFNSFANYEELDDYCRDEGLDAEYERRLKDAYRKGDRAAFMDTMEDMDANPSNSLAEEHDYAVSLEREMDREEEEAKKGSARYGPAGKQRETREDLFDILGYMRDNVQLLVCCAEDWLRCTATIAAAKDERELSKAFGHWRGLLWVTMVAGLFLFTPFVTDLLVSNMPRLLVAARLPTSVFEPFIGGAALAVALTLYGYICFSLTALVNIYSSPFARAWVQNNVDKAIIVSKLDTAANVSLWLEILVRKQLLLMGDYGYTLEPETREEVVGVLKNFTAAGSFVAWAYGEDEVLSSLIYVLNNWTSIEGWIKSILKMFPKSVVQTAVYVIMVIGTLMRILRKQRHRASPVPALPSVPIGGELQFVNAQVSGFGYSPVMEREMNRPVYDSLRPEVFTGEEIKEESRTTQAGVNVQARPEEYFTGRIHQDHWGCTQMVAVGTLQYLVTAKHVIDKANEKEPIGWRTKFTWIQVKHMVMDKEVKLDMCVARYGMAGQPRLKAINGKDLRSTQFKEPNLPSALECVTLQNDDQTGELVTPPVVVKSSSVCMLDESFGMPNIKHACHTYGGASGVALWNQDGSAAGIHYCTDSTTKENFAINAILLLNFLSAAPVVTGL
jgi:hypothetical protein